MQFLHIILRLFFLQKSETMSNFGKTIHNMRLAQKISQQELAKDLFDRSEISKIENAELSTTYENEIKLIKRLGLTPNEFEYICNGYHISTKSQLLHRFLNLAGSIDKNKINNLLNDCLLVKNDNDIKNISIILRSLLIVDKPNGLNKARELVQPIWFSSLRNVKVLTATDITILNSILFAFDYLTAKEIISKIISDINQYYPFLRSLKADTLINQAIMEITKHKFKLAITTLTSLKPLLKDLKQYDKLLVVNARLAICQNNRKEALDQINLLHKIGADALAKSLSREIKDSL